MGKNQQGQRPVEQFAPVPPDHLPTGARTTVRAFRAAKRLAEGAVARAEVGTRRWDALRGPAPVPVWSGSGPREQKANPRNSARASGQSPAALRGPPGAASASRGARERRTVAARPPGIGSRAIAGARGCIGEETELRAWRGGGVGVGRRGAGVAAAARSFRRRPRPPDAPLALQPAARRPERAPRVTA